MSNISGRVPGRGKARNALSVQKNRILVCMGRFAYLYTCISESDSSTQTIALTPHHHLRFIDQKYSWMTCPENGEQDHHPMHFTAPPCPLLFVSQHFTNAYFIVPLPLFLKGSK